VNIYKPGRIFMGNLPSGGDLLDELTKIIEKNDIKTGVFNVIGAISNNAYFGYYDQLNRKFCLKNLNKNLEIVSCSGNISILNGKPMVHAHIVMADENGNTYGGHLGNGTNIYAAEAYIQEFLGKPLIRTYDENTGLNLW
jgi:uncharacterized protein